MFHTAPNIFVGPPNMTYRWNFVWAISTLQSCHSYNHICHKRYTFSFVYCLVGVNVSKRFWSDFSWGLKGSIVPHNSHYLYHSPPPSSSPTNMNDKQTNFCVNNLNFTRDTICLPFIATHRDELLKAIMGWCCLGPLRVQHSTQHL